TMRTGGAGGGHGVVHTFNREGRGQVGRDGAAHGAGNAVRADFADAFFAQNIDRFDNVAGGSAAGTGHQAGARVADHLFSETGLGNGFTHGQIGVRGRVAHKACQIAVDDIVEVNLWLAGHMAAQAQLSVFRHKTNTGTLCLQRRQHFLFVVTNATNDTNTCNHNSTHNHSTFSAKYHLHSVSDEV